MMSKCLRLRDRTLRPRMWGSSLYEIPDILVRKIISTNLFTKSLVYRQSPFIEKLISESNHLEVLISLDVPRMLSNILGCTFQGSCLNFKCTFITYRALHKQIMF